MSNNFWGDLSNIEKTKNPLNILKEQSGYLLSATNNLIYAELRNRNRDPFSTDPNCEFITVYSLKSKMMDKYEFQLFTLYYDVVFYPMYIEVDSNIREKLRLDEYHMVKNEGEFLELLKKILDNEFTKSVISSLYVMSK